MLKYTQYIIFIGIICASVFLFFIYQKTINHKKIINKTPINTVDDVPLEEGDVQSIDNSVEVYIPLNESNIREIKKPFGIFITPETSPVQPERFQGYHTGTDFEIFDNEIDTDVTIRSVCDGNVIFKNFVNGYGGVLIQDCVLNEQIVTVLYGHLNMDTVQINVGDKLRMSDDVGLLGDNNSKQTDFERKHLHIGIHKGSDINVQGYTQNKENLNKWINVCTVVNCIN